MNKLPRRVNILNKNSRSISKLDFFESTCRKPINIYELKTYIKEKVAFGYISNLNGITYFNILIPIFGHQHYVVYKVVPIENWDDKYHMISLITTNEPTINYRSITRYDLLTTFRILSLRTNCSSISPTFARDQTLRILDEVVNTWNTPETAHFLYTYLYMNMIIMILPIYSLNPIFDEHDSDYHNILRNFNNKYGRYIPNMIEDIENYIMKL